MRAKKIRAAGVILLVLTLLPDPVFAGSLFGPPQPVSRKEGGLHTAIGYWRMEDKFKGGGDYVLKQNQVYTHAGYGARNIWEVYGRLGIASLKIDNAFSPADARTSTSKDGFADTWNNLFGTLGGKLFYPHNNMFGIGAFLQGTYYFSDFSDNASGSRDGVPFTADLKIKDMWSLNAGIGVQMSVAGTKFYAGPYFYRSEAKASPSPALPGLRFTGDTTMENKSSAGGFAGIDTPLGKGFRLNIEGQYSERLSVGMAVIFVY